MNLNEILLPLFLTVILVIAGINDIRFRRIPNRLTYPVILGGLLYCSISRGLEGCLFSLGGIGVGGAVMLLPYVMGGTGAGDVKLMAAVGGLLGPKGAFVAFLFTSLVGGLYALMLLAFQGYLKETAKRYWGIIESFVLTRSVIYVPPSEKEKKPKLRYGVAIALGTLISVFGGVKI